MTYQPRHRFSEPQFNRMPNYETEDNLPTLKQSIHRRVNTIFHQLDSNIALLQENYDKKCQELKTKSKKKLNLDEYKNINTEIKDIDFDYWRKKQERKQFDRISKDTLFRVNKFPKNGRLNFNERKIVKRFDIECSRIETNLPIYAYQSRIIDQVWNNQVSVIIGETGSGKTTQICQYLYEGRLIEPGRKLVCTQPRKIAAISTAKRVAEEMGEEVGEMVGYKTGIDSKCSPRNTKILFMTDHILLNECLKDENLSRYSCIIIDEAHERSIYTDLLIGFIKKILSRRKNLKVVITSATIDPKLFENYFHPMLCPVLNIPGRLHPVEVVYSDNSPNDKEFVNLAIDKALDLHRNVSIECGSILVFLTTPTETENACQVMYNRVQGLSMNKPCLCLPLHGKLDMEEQQRIFENSQADTRKIIFATNSGETSITIPNVGMVIDSGLVKEASYDPSRNLDILAVTLITQSIADQRKGRAGRTRGGKCYRLYDKATYFQTMKIDTNPEILRVNLGLAFLKLYSLGIDPSKFDFVESPKQSHIQDTVAMLSNLGAVDGGCITPVGEWISKLPLNPYYSVFIHEAMRLNVALEAIVVSAISSLSGSSLFYHRNAAKDPIAKKKLETSYMKFSHSFGDIFTSLNVFREWLKCDNHFSSSFCTSNSLNKKNILLVKSTTNEILLTLKKEFAINILFRFINDESDSDKVIQKILFKTFRHNLCHYLGRDSAGYLVIRSDERVHLFPSSSLKCLGAMPEWIFFLSTMKTHKAFAVNVHPIEELHLQQYVEEGSLDIDLQAIKNKRLEETVNITMGSNVFSCFVGPYFKNKNELEKKFQGQCKRHEVIVMESVKENGSLRVFTSNQDEKENIFDEIVSSIGNLTSNVRSEIVEHVIGGNTRAIIEPGANVSRILFSNEILKLDVFGKADRVRNLDRNEVIAEFERYGSIIACNKIEKGPKSMWGFIVFEDHTSAGLALDYHENKGGLFVKPATAVENVDSFNQKKRLEFDFSMEFSFGTIGRIAIVKFSDVNIVLQALHYQHAIYDNKKGKSFWFYRLKNLSQESEGIIVCGVPPYIPRQNLSNILCRVLSIHPKCITGIEFQDHNEELLTALQYRNQKSCNLNIGKGKYFLDFIPNRGNPSVSVFGRFKNMPDGIKSFKNIAKSLQDTSVEDFSDSMFSWTVFISGRHYEVVVNDLQEILNSYQGTSGESYDVQLSPGGYKFIIYVHSINEHSIKSFSETKCNIEALIYVDQMNCAHSQHLHHLFGKKGRIILDNIEFQTKTWIVTDLNTVHLKVYGTEANRVDAFKEINQFEIKLSQKEMRHVDLKAVELPNGLAKRIFLKYGLDLEEFINKSQLSNCELDLLNHSLAMIGDEESFTKAMQLIQEEVNVLNQVDLSTKLAKMTIGCDEECLESECCACLCPIDSSISYRVESCGHPYCLFCIVEYVKVSQKDKSFPLICIKEDCKQPYSITDLRAFEKMGFVLMKDLFQASIETFVAKNNTEFFYCGKPDCLYIFKITKLSQRMQCPLCNLVQCSACKAAPYHEKRSCKQKSREKLPAELEKWFKEKPKYRKQCPVCHVGIEKNQGCNHIVCLVCNKHICWVCLTSFDEINECYGHLRRTHQNFV